MRIIPAIDIIEGKAVRLEKGNFLKKKVYADKPLEVAKSFEDHGLRYLHLVDLDGAKSGRVMHQKILEEIKSGTSLIVDYGGGIRTLEDGESLKDAGADQINLGSIAVKNLVLTERFLKSFGPEFVILSPDVKGKQIAIHGWQEESEVQIFDFIKDYHLKGVNYFVCTDISKDGMLAGSSVDLYKEIIDRQPDIKLIASGGVTKIQELEELKELGVNGAIIGKAIYEGRMTLRDLGHFIKSQS
ncbi:1-(5-phosphoribosyl)-5-[(5-phosphoribosylamino)methylideneamino]imidazole-4-carboxamide isomerase [Portibacter marinus]|uniref:1-(5-phosphoribosyl)-5-[(5- phosphoribosylamino)methylideneamino]imidazole-4- carboxamide isomerase n=1 Tax=Portibacter marinus TaxID=2898660 RepID=UPI001F198585|nr:1-(5-phosphoribosyl)-5-[(5-phosphoribosylamino)methylideneamino]imidazole-4-carboxamide isomerase [Portibacter marinus]